LLISESPGIKPRNGGSHAALIAAQCRDANYLIGKLKRDHPATPNPPQNQPQFPKRGVFWASRKRNRRICSKPFDSIS
jgi:hypothetical protein